MVSRERRDDGAGTIQSFDLQLSPLGVDVDKQMFSLKPNRPGRERCLRRIGIHRGESVTAQNRQPRGAVLRFHLGTPDCSPTRARLGEIIIRVRVREGLRGRVRMRLVLRGKPKPRRTEVFDHGRLPAVAINRSSCVAFAALRKTVRPKASTQLHSPPVLPPLAF